MLAAAQDQLRAWEVAGAWATMALSVGPFGGVPDVWPHIAAALTRAGFRPEAGHDEAVYGGPLDGVAEPGAPRSPASRCGGRLGPSAPTSRRCWMAGRWEIVNVSPI